MEKTLVIKLQKELTVGTIKHTMEYEDGSKDERTEILFNAKPGSYLVNRLGMVWHEMYSPCGNYESYPLEGRVWMRESKLHERIWNEAIANGEIPYEAEYKIGVEPKQVS